VEEKTAKADIRIMEFIKKLGGPASEVDQNSRKGKTMTWAKPTNPLTSSHK
jgi:hypothetical protein